MNKQNTKY